MKTKEELQKAIADAQAELDSLEKSANEDEVDPISELEKALADFEEAEKLEKAKEEELEKAKKEDAEEGEAGEGDGETADGEHVEKSLADLSALLGDDLVKASEEYALLRKSVEETQAGTDAKLDALSGLVTGIAKAVVGLSKAMAEFGKQPFEKSLAHLGIEEKGKREEIAKSHAEVRERLIKAIHDGELDEMPMGLLQRVDRHGAQAVPEHIREQLNISLPSA
jgi:hypothetical protein